MENNMSDIELIREAIEYNAKDLDDAKYLLKNGKTVIKELEENVKVSLRIYQTIDKTLREALTRLEQKEQPQGEALVEVVEQAKVYEYWTIDDVYNSADTAEELLRFVEAVNKHAETIKAALTRGDCAVGDGEVDRLRAVVDNVVLQAQMWAQEAKTQKSTVDAVGRQIGKHDWENIPETIAAIIEENKKLSAAPKVESGWRDIELSDLTTITEYTKNDKEDTERLIGALNACGYKIVKPKTEGE